MKKLEDLQVGDEVIIARLAGKSVGVVTRTTKLYIEVKSNDSVLMFNKKNGMRKGCSGYYTCHILIATDELKAEVEESNRRTKYQIVIRTCDMNSLPTDKLEQIYNIIKSKEK